MQETWQENGKEPSDSRLLRSLTRWSENTCAGTLNIGLPTELMVFSYLWLEGFIYITKAQSPRSICQILSPLPAKKNIYHSKLDSHNSSTICWGLMAELSGKQACTYNTGTNGCHWNKSWRAKEPWVMLRVANKIRFLRSRTRVRLSITQ